MKCHSIYKAVFVAVIALVWCSCSTSHYPKSEEEIVASIDNKPIYANELNAMIKQELQNEKNCVYEAKKKALDQLIESRIIQEEAKKKKMTAQAYIEHYTEGRINTLGVDSLLRKYGISTIFPLEGNEMLAVSVGPTTNVVPSLSNLKGKMVNDLLESLKKERTIRIYLYPPQNPLRAIHLLSEETSLAYYRHNNLRF